MVLINEISDYQDLRAVLRGTVKEPPTWRVRPELRNRVICAFALERTHWRETEGLISWAAEPAFRNVLGRLYIEEEIHQAMFASLLRPNVSPWDHVVGSELALIYFLSTIAQIEPDESVKAIFNYLIIDHLTHAKELAAHTGDLGLSSELRAEAAGLPDGRKFEAQFCQTQDILKRGHLESADSATKVNLRLARSMDTLVRELVESVGLMGATPSLVELGRLISAVEVEHHLLLNSLFNPDETVIERAFYNELAEIMGLNRLLLTEKEGETKETYEFVASEDEDHLGMLGALISRLEGRDPATLSDSQALAAKPRRTVDNHLQAILKESGRQSLAMIGRKEAA